MHCPDCGARATANQKFCRSCGFSLEKVVQLLAEQPSLTASSWGIIQKLIIEKGELLTGILLIMFFLLIATLALSPGYIEMQRKKLSVRNPQEPIIPPHAEATNPLPPESYLHSLASVTEHTTARLEERPKTAS
jgi:hypothetical protein